MVGQPRDAVWANMLAKMIQAQADLKARLERLERLIKERPYLTASSVPVLPSTSSGPEFIEGSKVEGPVQ